ncbi:hypothetical protein DH2020_046191 [Rehmannia glutinosa]|uniref:Ammonium transporter AmtB-like domain-containing protein n=1 Tax=Rehmannia glutinosa TaxID=99300 RepID=A0ABR0UCM1_REHGL
MSQFPQNLLPDEASPEWMNKGDNAWQMTAAALVGLQSVPGLVILYGGIVKKKWAVNSAFMALYAFASVLVCWVTWAYRMSFGDKMLPFWGFPNTTLDQKFLFEKAFLGSFPNSTMVFFQFVFAAITLILIAGALLGRMNFYAWMMFVPLWLTFSYTVSAFSVWSPEGWLAKMGVIDFAGGYVIHVASGVAGFTAAYWVRWTKVDKGPRSIFPEQHYVNANSAALLWMGWTGFNGGAPFLSQRPTLRVGVLNTHICTATSLLTWLTLDIIVFKKPTVFGVTQGIITGLVCITPAAGVVQGWAAIIMGLLSGSIPWFTMMILQKKLPILKKVDDTLGVLHTHAVAGILGGVLTGLLAEPKLARLFYLVDDWQHYIGLFYGLQSGRARAGARQLGVQLLGIVFVVLWNILITSLICVVIKLVVPLRLSDEIIEKGDESVHGEEAYALYGDGERHESYKQFNAYGFAA